MTVISSLSLEEARLERHGWTRTGEERWLDEAAAELGVRRETLYRYIKAGKLRRIRRPRDKRTYVDMGTARYLVDPDYRAQRSKEWLEGAVKSFPPELQERTAELLLRLREEAWGA